MLISAKCCRFTHKHTHSISRQDRLGCGAADSQGLWCPSLLGRCHHVSLVGRAPLGVPWEESSHLPVARSSASERFDAAIGKSTGPRKLAVSLALVTPTGEAGWSQNLQGPVQNINAGPLCKNEALRQEAPAHRSWSTGPLPCHGAGFAGSGWNWTLQGLEAQALRSGPKGVPRGLLQVWARTGLCWHFLVSCLPSSDVYGIFHTTGKKIQPPTQASVQVEHRGPRVHLAGRCRGEPLPSCPCTAWPVCITSFTEISFRYGTVTPYKVHNQPRLARPHTVQPSPVYSRTFSSGPKETHFH